jgi:nucleoside 2-deoxyribosyltransferase
MKKAYIAGPMRGHDHFNFDAFDEAKVEVQKLGFHPISPADMDRLYEGWGKYPPEDFVPDVEDRERFMARDMAAIASADAVYMLIGWQTSSGAKAEIAYANFLEKEVIYQEQVRSGKPWCVSARQL